MYRAKYRRRRRRRFEYIGYIGNSIALRERERELFAERKRSIRRKRKSSFVQSKIPKKKKKKI